jgi:hypothetical protein
MIWPLHGLAGGRTSVKRAQLLSCSPSRVLFKSLPKKGLAGTADVRPSAVLGTKTDMSWAQLSQQSERMTSAMRMTRFIGIAWLASMPLVLEAADAPARIAAYVWRDCLDPARPAGPPNTVAIRRAGRADITNPFKTEDDRWLYDGDVLSVKEGGGAVLLLPDLTRTNLGPSRTWPPEGPTTFSPEGLMRALRAIQNKRQNIRVAGSRNLAPNAAALAIVAAERLFPSGSNLGGSEPADVLVYWVAPADYGTVFRFEALDSGAPTADVLANLQAVAPMPGREYSGSSLRKPVLLHGARLHWPASLARGQAWLRVRHPTRTTAGRSPAYQIPSPPSDAKEYARLGSSAASGQPDDKLLSGTALEAAGFGASALCLYLEAEAQSGSASAHLAIAHLLAVNRFGDLADCELCARPKTPE